MTRQSILETQELLVTLALLVLIGILGAALVDQWTWRAKAEPDYKFYRTVALSALNQVPVVIGRKPAQVGLMCQTF